ncbi:uncharacterized protein BJ212DRAFT_1480841 [Suillus subaureus]|uniref:Uncharacterized protein n=1 Tax=Suillus subaureus TaxID=48587 RepID=A0A9P7JDP7_9AGAM|nr:uncharacterized protein BJ212DRAFT_1480841 [Suillus subaureus]KAG1816386.1 hypothetical protein BJ212DRAFT_1480841 [Suillus subaureus]
MQYMELIEFMVDQLLDEDHDEDSDKESDDTANGHSGSDISIWTASPTWPESPVSPTLLITSALSDNSLTSLLTAYSEFLLHDIPDMCKRVFTQFADAITALHDELHLLEEWALFLPENFCCKLCVDVDVFDELTKLIQGHTIFYNNLNNPQLPVPIQLTIFLNGTGHYGNAATTEDISD